MARIRVAEEDLEALRASSCHPGFGAADEVGHYRRER